MRAVHMRSASHPSCRFTFDTSTTEPCTEQENKRTFVLSAVLIVVFTLLCTTRYTSPKVCMLILMLELVLGVLAHGCIFHGGAHQPDTPKELANAESDRPYILQDDPEVGYDRWCLLITSRPLFDKDKPTKSVRFKNPEATPPPPSPPYEIQGGSLTPSPLCAPDFRPRNMSL